MTAKKNQKKSPVNMLPKIYKENQLVSSNNGVLKKDKPK
jgi:hypothetical protein